MAIQMDSSWKGISIPGAYWKIETVGVTVSKLSAAVYVEAYKSAEESTDKANVLGDMSFDLTPAEMAALTGKTIPGVDPPQIEAANPMEWCYKWLLLKPEFAGAVSV